MSSKINASTSGVGGLVSTADNSGILELQSGGNTKFTVSSEGAYGTLRMEAAKAATGTAVDFTGIPSWVKRITVLFAGVSTNGTTHLMVRLGTSAGIDTTGYDSGSGHMSATAVSAEGSSAGFMIRSNASALLHNGSMTIFNMASTTWVSSHTMGAGASIFATWGGGTKTMSGVVDRIRITTSNGTDVFDSGIINLLLEG